VERTPAVAPSGFVNENLAGGAETMKEAVIRTNKLTKEFVRGSFRVVALKEVDITVAQGDFLALMGPSGSGKSTLLHLIAAMDHPTAGEISVLGANLHSLNERELALWRSRHIGFVFQSFNLLPVLTALENVELPLRLTGLTMREKREHAENVLKFVGLADRLHHLPRELSGGQEQRVAIARAMVTDPDLILLDEPTGNLDAASAQEILGLLAELNGQFDKTVVMVTHDPHAAGFAGVVRYIEKGLLLAEGRAPSN
jgi:putative ABC transport system ATP-binding protein